MASHNILLDTDSYKQTHWNMCLPGIKKMGSYFESREGAEYNSTVFFGLQYLLLKYFVGVKVTPETILEAETFCREHFGTSNIFNRDGWTHILMHHEGKLPVSIKAVPEGTLVPVSNVMLTIENTCEQCFWLTNHLETLLVELWYSCTIATISRGNGLELFTGLQQSGDTKNLPFMLHDFGFRGSTSRESASIGGAAHLVNFLGTDNIAAVRLCKEYYDENMAGFSVPAAEHSGITSWGKDRERDAYKHILDMYPSGIVSIVSDSYDIENACANIWGKELKKYVEEKPNRRLVIRPDSGEPTVIVPKILLILASKFGYRTNSKGYRVLPDYIRLLQGDGITRKSLPVICKAVIDAGFSLDNMVFGSGGGLLQDCNRDTQKFALKCSWIKDKDDNIIPVFKDPASDTTKRSKAGMLKLVNDVNYRINRITGKHDNWTQMITVSDDDPRQNILREVFRDGDLLIRDNLKDIRKRVT